MDLYGYIKTLHEKGEWNILISNGIAPLSLNQYYEIYSYYLDCLKTCDKYQCILKVSEKFNVSERSVYVIKNKMEKRLEE